MTFESTYNISVNFNVVLWKQLLYTGRHTVYQLMNPLQNPHLGNRGLLNTYRIRIGHSCFAFGRCIFIKSAIIKTISKLTSPHTSSGYVTINKDCFCMCPYFIYPPRQLNDFLTWICIRWKLWIWEWWHLPGLMWKDDACLGSVLQHRYILYVTPMHITLWILFNKTKSLFSD